MMPKFVYESLPYINLAVGCGILCAYQTISLTISGALFFLVGAFMWMMRSQNRRADQGVRLRDYGNFNSRLYEFKPFLYMLFALLSVNRISISLLEMIAVLIGLYGLHLVIKRSLHRHMAASSKAFR